ncbi:hypothetical protein TRVA0_047S00606 [Trichomonascus vanleenenianus]|uniref:guided entry of tail-anchored proteins factor 1 n=1 Tax=Trichomonascus vanleenenianus TaxID=2268995 RepID=UPI003ECB62CB
MSLLLYVLLCVIFGKIVSLIGKDTVGEFLWQLYISFAPSSTVSKLRHKQREAIDCHTKKTNTSSKDEFAKWAKLDRQYGKLKSEIEALNGSLNSSKTMVKRLVSAALFLLTTGSSVMLRIKHRKSAVFWLPEGIAPHSVVWGLGLTSAPLGSVSVSIWLMACNWALDTLINTSKKTYQYCTQPKVAVKPVESKAN